MGLYLLVILLAGGMLIGVPIFLAIGFATLAYVIDVGPMILPIFMQRLFAGTLSYSFAAVPLFMLAGAIMGECGITDRIIQFTRTLVGHWRGGLAQVNIATSIVFAGKSGSALADTAIVGSIMVPVMEKQGYERAYSAAVTAASATLSPIIPPSIVMVIYAAAFRVRVGSLFAAGVVPGFVLAFSMMVVTYVLARIRKYPSYPKATLREIGEATLAAWSALVMPLIILGGMFSGVFTANEAASVAVVYALVLALGVYRNTSLKQIAALFRQTALRTASILMILAVAQNFAWIISRERIPTIVAQWLLGITDHRVLLLLLIGLLLFVAGLFIERVVNLFLLGPILLPILTLQLEMHPIHAGLMMIFILGIGHVTPPFGAALYTIAMVSETKVEEIVRFMWPYIVGMIVVGLLITFVEPLSLWLPNALGLL